MCFSVRVNYRSTTQPTNTGLNQSPLNFGKHFSIYQQWSNYKFSQNVGGSDSGGGHLMQACRQA